MFKKSTPSLANALQSLEDTLNKLDEVTTYSAQREADLQRQIDALREERDQATQEKSRAFRISERLGELLK